VRLVVKVTGLMATALMTPCRFDQPNDSVKPPFGGNWLLGGG